MYRPPKKTRPAPWTLMHKKKVVAPSFKRIRPVSKRMSIAKLKYRRERAIFLQRNPWCAVYPGKRATEVHHTKGRAGKNFLDSSTWLAVSRAGHNRIHQVLPGLPELSGPAWAKRMGYLHSFIK